MVLEESIMINSTLEHVWKTFIDLSCWKDWSTVLQDISSGETGTFEAGKNITFCIRPFVFPVKLEPVVEEVVPYERVVWSGSYYGCFARHTLFFRETGNGVLLTSRESFEGMPALSLWILFPKKRLRELTISFLEEIKKAAES